MSRSEMAQLYELESNPSASSKILQSVREEFRSSGYKIIDLDQQAKILIGLLGISLLPKWSPVLPEGNASTLGTLDLGGASTQIVFAVPHPSSPSIETSKVTLFNKELALFADSFLCYGVGEMRKQLLAILAKKNNYEGELHHPCFAVGYTVNKTYSNMFKSSCTEKFASSTPQNSNMTIVGTGNAGQCENLISDLFNQTFPNITIPPLPDRFVARGSFAYTMNDLNVLNSASQTTYSNFLQGMQNYCSQNHSVVSQLKLYDPNTVCVNARYIHHLLSKTYGMSDDNWDSVVFTNSFNDMSLGWTLGYMTNITSHLAEVPSLDLYNISNFSFYFCLILTIVLILLGVVSIVFACKYQRQKYDSLNVPT
ncbi:ENTPD3 [Bugula neritina]|uniref:ENTPD3 n=1 Tax=Bugula neritina TaxID=10212 RepID=A0A7J7IS88_BUGNE|nr:ENTPD3 [Bugula neritina]